MQKRIFTIYNCGTAFNRNNRDELVADLAARTGGIEGFDWIINAGPGSNPNSKLSYFGKDPKTGVYQIQRLRPHARPGTFHPVAKTRKGWFSRTSRLWGMTTGSGWEDNVVSTLDHLGKMHQGNLLPHVINMAGWSRGAVTCHMIANALYKTYPHIPVNIFALDPVPGLGQWRKHRTEIDKNVRHYAVLYQEDEHRGSFKSVVVRHAPSTRFTIYNMPGAHGTGVRGDKKIYGGNMNLAVLAQDLCEKFLMEHGTRLQSPLGLTSDQQCEHYAKVRENITHYRKDTKGFWGGKVDRHDRRIFMGLGSRSHEFFINDHHDRLFKVKAPRLYSYLVESNPMRLMNKARDAATELGRLQNKLPVTFRVLINQTQRGNALVPLLKHRPQLHVQLRVRPPHG